MPLYEYRCSDCGEEFEKRVSFSEAEQAPSGPACQSRNTKKKLSLFASRGSSTGAPGASAGSSCGSSGGFT